MTTVENIALLKAQLNEFQFNVLSHICWELRRIGRKISTSEMDFVYFRPDVREFILALYVDGTNRVMVETGFNEWLPEADHEPLSDLISSGEISSNDLITLLEVLSQIKTCNSQNL